MSVNLLERERGGVRPGSGLGPYTRDYLGRVRGGGMGAVAAGAGAGGAAGGGAGGGAEGPGAGGQGGRLGRPGGCAVAQPKFRTAGSLANLLSQGGAITVIAMGLVFVLLLGEIGLSAGFTSGVCASVLAVLLTTAGLPWYVAVLGAVA